MRKQSVVRKYLLLTAVVACAGFAASHPALAQPG
jgi:hypothetical protein